MQENFRTKASAQIPSKCVISNKIARAIFRVTLLRPCDFYCNNYFVQLDTHLNTLLKSVMNPIARCIECYHRARPIFILFK